MDVVAFLLFEELNTAYARLGAPGSRCLLLLEGPRRPGPLRSALRSRRDPARASPSAPEARRPGRPSGRRRVPGIEANSGSLGMGVSKGRGIAWAKRHLGRGGRVVVMLGDGELQEGQNYEGLQAAAHERLANLTVVVDRNELQSDKPTDEIVSLGALGRASSGVRLGGRDLRRARPVGAARVFGSFRDAADRPQALVAETLKGKGVSFMEHPVALREGGGTYRWHAGAPDDESFERAFAELVVRARRPAREPRARTASARARRGRGATKDRNARGRARVGRRSPHGGHRRVRRRRVRRRARSTRCRARETSSSSMPTSPRTAGFARSNSRTRTASSSAGSPSRTWCRRPPGWRATASCLS